MAAHHLVGDRAGHVCEGEQPRLLGHARVIDDLEQQIAQLIGERDEVAPGDGVGHLVGFLDRIGRDAGEILFEVPGAAGGGVAKLRHDVQQPAEFCQWVGQGDAPGTRQDLRTDTNLLRLRDTPWLRGHDIIGSPALSQSLSGLQGLFRRAAPGSTTASGEQAAAEPIPPPIADLQPGEGVSFHRLRTARDNWVAAGLKRENGAAFLAMAEALDAAHAVIVILSERHRQLCLIVAPDARVIAIRSDGLRAIAISALAVQSRGCARMRLQHPCGMSRFLGVSKPGQGGPDGLVVFDSGGLGELDRFELVPVAEADVPSVVQSVGREFASVAVHPFTAEGLLEGLASRAVRGELAEPLIRLLRPDESQRLARDLLERPQTLALLRRLLPANPWSQEVLPALAAWNRARTPASPAGVLVSPGSDEYAGRPLEGHGMPQAGQVLAVLARRQVRPRRSACIVTTMRNEGAYLLDWLSYHLSIGFEHVFIYTNDNQDGSDDLLRLLAGHGVITLVENARAPILSPQHKAYSHALMLLPQILDFRWTALIDADEYIGFDTGMFRSIIDFISWHETQPADAIALCWLLHVAGTNDRWRGESTLRRFPMREQGVNPHVKSLFRTAMFWHAHPHFPHTPLGSPFVFRTEDGRIHHTHAITGRLAAFAEAPSANLAWINHYILRTAGESVLKLARGRADQTGRAAHWAGVNLEHTARTFVSLARPEIMVRDERILACAARQPAVLERLMALPGVAEQAAKIQAAMPARITDAARSFLEGVPAEGLPPPVLRFREAVAAIA